MIEETELQENTQGQEEPIRAADDIPDASTESSESGEEKSILQSPNESAVDYARIAAEDLFVLQREFPALASIRSIAELPNCTRYGALRDLGLSPKEAYLAIGGRQAPRQDNRSHLRSSVPRSHTGIATQMSASELENARVLFGNLSDREIARLYQKVQS